MALISKRLWSVALLCHLTSASLLQAEPSDKLLRLEAEMLQYIASNERDTFFNITEQLKESAKDEGEDMLFYKAWSKEAMFEAMHQNYSRALEIAQSLADYAKQESSMAGKYYALHTRAAILQQQDSLNQAEKLYLQATALHHQLLPKESAAEDLRELLKTAYVQNDFAKAKRYASQLLAEPNLKPHHKGRTLYRLSIIAFEEDDVTEFNHIYDEMKRLMQTDGIRTLNLYTEVNYHIINGDYKQALRLADWLSPDTCAERKAIIYHRIGDNEKAYQFMQRYKHVADSMRQVSHSNVVSNLYLRMNNDRLRLQREMLEHKNNELRHRFYYATAIAVILVLLLLMYQRHRIIKLLKHDNQMLSYTKDGAERALEELNELSFYESKTEIPLATHVKINRLGNRLTTLTQENCYKGVTAIYQTELDDDFEIVTSADALEKLLAHLLDYSARYTYKGTVTLHTEESAEYVKFSITDTSQGLGVKPRVHLTDIFAEEANAVRYVGLNFSICQSITRLLKGRIWHDVAYTQGTRFCVELPKHP